MHIKIIFLIYVIVYQSASASECDQAVNIIKQYSSLTSLSVDQARQLVNQLWKEVFSRAKGPSAIQKLTSGFALLLEKLDDPQQKLLIDQSYLMWCSGRTHGFNKESSDEDVKSIKNIRDIVAQHVASSMIERAKSDQPHFTSIEKFVQNMIQENTSPFIRQQDDDFILSIRSALCEISYKQLDVHRQLNNTLNQRKLKERTIEGIWDAHLHDVLDLENKKDRPYNMVIRLIAYNHRTKEIGNLEKNVTQFHQKIEELQEENKKMSININDLHSQMNILKSTKPIQKDYHDEEVQTDVEPSVSSSAVELDDSPDSKATKRSLFPGINNHSPQRFCRPGFLPLGYSGPFMLTPTDTSKKEAESK